MSSNVKKGLMVIFAVIMVGILFVVGMFMFFTSTLKKYEFTTDETRAQYANAVGYTQYEDENIKFQYPEAWIVGSELTPETDDVIFVEKLDPATTLNVEYQIITEEEAGGTAEDYSPYRFNVNTKATGKSKTTIAERWVMVNDKETYMYYTGGSVPGRENVIRYNLTYYTFLGDEKVMYVFISAGDKEMLETIAASLEY